VGRAVFFCGEAGGKNDSVGACFGYTPRSGPKPAQGWVVGAELAWHMSWLACRALGHPTFAWRGLESVMIHFSCLSDNTHAPGPFLGPKHTRMPPPLPLHRAHASYGRSKLNAPPAEECAPLRTLGYHSSMSCACVCTLATDRHHTRLAMGPGGSMAAAGRPGHQVGSLLWPARPWERDLERPCLTALCTGPFPTLTLAHPAHHAAQPTPQPSGGLDTPTFDTPTCPPIGP
jgi:hypothetical protein